MTESFADMHCGYESDIEMLAVTAFADTGPYWADALIYGTPVAAKAGSNAAARAKGKSDSKQRRGVTGGYPPKSETQR